MTSTSDEAASQRPPRRPGAHVAVDVGFAILLLVCAIRYFSHHPLAGTGIWVLVLAIGVGASYAVAVLGRPGAALSSAPRPEVGTRQRIGLLAATGLWLPLTLIAPSFGWCAFALFFAVHRALRGTAALFLSGMIVVAVSTGLFLMSSGADLGLVLGPFFGGLVLSYAYTALDRALTAQKSLNAELLRTREQLARSERDAGAHAERGRVASELHDNIVQRTASALLLLESDDVQSSGSTAAVSEARESLRATLVETRQLLHGLAGPPRVPSSLSATLRSNALAAGAAFSVAGRERAVPDPVVHALQRVVQEALLNAQKHAEANTVQVTLIYQKNAIAVEIADDGIGFSHDPTHHDENSGFGIRAMTWRIQNLGGTLAVESHPGHGTVVAATVPSHPETLRA